MRYLTVDDTDVSAADQCQQVVDFVQANHLPAVQVETNGLGKFLPEILKQTFRRHRLRCAVLTQTSKTQKDQRILDAFDVLLANRALKVHERVKQTALYREMQEWIPGGGGHDDGVDAVAGCLLSAPVRLPKTVYQPIAKPDWRFFKEE